MIPCEYCSKTINIHQYDWHTVRRKLFEEFDRYDEFLSLRDNVLKTIDIVRLDEQQPTRWKRYFRVKFVMKRFLSIS